MADPKGDNPLFDNNVSSILIGVGSAVFVVTMYRLLVMCLCNQHHHMITTNQRETQQEQRAPRWRLHPAQPMNLVSHMIPAHKYKKTEAGDGDDGEGEDVTCAVCLGDFEEGEELRTLPECMHSFHVPCIDVWLCSHSSCPVCRADATPLPVLGSGDQLNEHHNIGVMQIAIVQNGSERG